MTLPSSRRGVPFMPDGWAEGRPCPALGSAEPGRRSVRAGLGTGSRLARFLLVFVAAYGVLHLGYFAIPDDFLRNVVIHYGVVEVAVLLLNLIDPAARAVAVSGAIQSSGPALEVVRGCDGAGSMFLILAAVVAFPAAVRDKLTGAALGLTLMFLLNEGRIVGLYFLAHDEAWFTRVHLYVAPTLIVLAGGVFFHAWAARAGRESDGAAQP